MAVTSGFFNSLNHDRKYNAEQMSAIFDGIINDGVFMNIGTSFGVKALTGSQISVGVGRAWFNSAWVYNDAELPLTAELSELVLNRYDAVVIEIDHTEAVRSGSIKIIKGTPSESPQYPTMVRTATVNQYPLAYILRKASVNDITQADITNRVGTTDCPYITGILKVQSIDNIVAQWEGEWDTWKGQWDQWMTQWDQWFEGQKIETDLETSEYMTQMQAEFENWFNSLEVMLDSDVAANLANSVIDLQNRFDTLARERAVYDNMQDSTDDTILDSNNNPIEGRTVMGASGSGESSGSNRPQSITPEDIGAARAIHANNHSAAGSDPLTPKMIGAADADHTHTFGWNDIQDKPTSFPPSQHTHNASDVIGALTSEGGTINGDLNINGRLTIEAGDGTNAFVSNANAYFNKAVSIFSSIGFDEVSMTIDADGCGIYLGDTSRDQSARFTFGNNGLEIYTYDSYEKHYTQLNIDPMETYDNEPLSVEDGTDMAVVLTDMNFNKWTRSAYSMNTVDALLGVDEE